MRLASVVVAAGLATVCSAQGGGLASLPDETAEQLKAWAQRLERPVLLDLDPFTLPRARFWDTLPGGETGVQVVAFALNRDWRQVEGAQILWRRSATGRFDRFSPRQSILPWLERISPAQRQSLLGDGIKLAELGSSERETVVRLIGTTPDAVVPFLEREDQTRVRVEVLFDLEVPGRRTPDGRPTTVLVPRTFRRGPEMPPLTNPDGPIPQSAATTPLRPKELEPAAEGRLDFGDPKVVTFAEAVRRARETFGKQYIYDLRLASAPMLAAGRWNEANWNEAFRLLATTDGRIVPSPTPEELRDALLELLPGLVEGDLPNDKLRERFSVRDFFDGKSVDVSDLLGLDPELDRRLGRLGLTAGTRVELKAYPLWVVECPGSREIPPLTGSNLRTTTPNRIRLVID